ncbi:hypothetical protein D3C78_299580 [compost metagenome]
MTADHRLPSLSETLRVEGTVDPVAVLHVVDAGARLQQGMQQQSLLHRRQRVDVLDLCSSDRQGIDLLLVQLRQGEVRGREAAGARGQAMLDQGDQLEPVGLDQCFDGLRVIALTAEGPAQLQFTAIHLAIDAQPVGQRRRQVVGEPGAFIHRLVQRIGLELLVELAQVVEGNTRLGQRRHGFAHRRIGQVAQHAVAQTLVRHITQLFLDGLDRSALPRGFFDVQWAQAQRVGAGEPADATGQVHVLEQALAAVAFQLHQHRAVTAPAAQYAGQGGQQQVVDLGVIGSGRLLQQLPGAGRIQAHAEGLRLLVQVGPLRMIAGQFAAGGAQLCLPPGLLVTQRVTAGISHQACRPIAHGAGLGRQRLAAVQRLQIFQQHAPGHAIDHQVVDGQQQALTTLAVFDQQGAQQRPLCQVEAALHIAVQRLAGAQIGYRSLPEQLAMVGLDVLALPLSVCLGEAQAQGIMVLQQLLQRLLQGLAIQAFDRHQQYRLVPVLGLRHVAVEEPVLDRRQRCASAQRALIDLSGFTAADHRGQGLDGLMLEQVARGEMQPGLTPTADHLDRQDRVAAQFEEVVLQTDLLHVQYLAPDRRQLLLQLAARRFIVLAALLQVRRRQGAAVELAIAGERHLLKQHQVGRHHIVRQVQAQLRLQRFTQGNLPGGVRPRLIADQITGQLLATGHVQGQDHGLAHRGVFEQAGFDFAQLDTEAANLHLMVDSTDILHQTVSALAHQVAGTVQAPAVVAERVGDKALGAQTGALVVTLGQAGATDVQLANAALRHQGQVGIEDVRRAGTDHAADRHAAGAGFKLLGSQARQGHDHGFGRAIGVEELLRRERLANALQVLAGQCLTASDDQAHRQACVVAGQPLGELAAVAWGKAEYRYLLFADQRADFFRAPLSLPAQDHPRTAEQRHQQALGGRVEVD